VDGLRHGARDVRPPCSTASAPISIGAAVHGLDGFTADELARAADAALYDAKRGVAARARARPRVEPQARAAR